jgi:hypothetical protein
MSSLDPTKYIRSDNGTMIHDRAIVWMRQIEECIHVCTRKTGCSEHPVQGTTHSICKGLSPTTYAKLVQITDPSGNGI